MFFLPSELTRPEIAYGVAPEHQYRGIATTALPWPNRFGVTLRDHRVVSCVSLNTRALQMPILMRSVEPPAELCPRGTQRLEEHGDAF